jgi:hypothetical protein
MQFSAQFAFAETSASADTKSTCTSIVPVDLLYSFCVPGKLGTPGSAHAASEKM